MSSVPAPAPSYAPPAGSAATAAALSVPPAPPLAEVQLRLATPEGVVFSLPLAGPALRMLALLVDLGIVYAALLALMRLLGPLAALSSAASGVVYLLAAFLAPIFYAMALEWTLRGQTIGKRLLHIRVLDARGLPLAGWQVVIRNLARAVDSLAPFYTVGGAACLLSRHYRRLGDLLAGTVVARDRVVPAPNLAALSPEPFNSLLGDPRLAFQLRRSADADIAALVLAALVRRDDLRPAARARLFSRLAGFLQSRAPLPDELRETLGDERYLRAVAGVLFPAAPATPPSRA